MTPASPRHVVQLGGRLGNLLFEVAFGLALEARTGTSWCVCGNLDGGTAKTLEAWTGSLPAATPEEVAALTGGPSPAGKVRRAVQRLLPVGWRTWVLQDTSAFRPAYLSRRKAAFWSGYWQSPKYFEDQAPVVRRSLRFRGILSPGLAGAEILARHEGSVGVHVRRGDYLTTPGFGVLDPAFYRKALDRLASSGPVLVFSDDPAWCRENLDWGRLFTVVEGGLPEEDLHLMTLCHHHVISQSTFSWWGAWLSGRPGGRVVAPDTWFPSFGRRPSPADIYPDHWHRGATHD